MTFHQTIKTNLTVTAPFEWPALPIATNLPTQMQIGAFDVAIADQSITLTGPTSPDAAQMMVTLRLSDETLRVFVPEDGMAALLDLHGIADDWQNYKADTMAMVIEHLMHPVFEAAGLEPESDFAVLKVGRAGKMTPEVGLLAELPCGKTVALGIDASKMMLARLITHLSANTIQPERPTFDDLSFHVTLLGPSFHVPAERLAACAPGDGFLLERDWSSLARAQLSVAGQICAAARHMVDGFQLSGQLAIPNTPAQRKEPNMSMIEDSQIDSLPVTLRICLGETMLTLSQLRSLEDGDVLPFAEELPTTVDISANGQPFGRGDLVRIDGQVAVRLTKIGQDSWKT